MKKLKKLWSLLLVVAMILSMSACGADENSNTDKQNQSVVMKKPTEDRSGAAINVPEEVDEIVCLAPSIAETLMDLNCTEYIIGIDTQTQAYGYDTLSSDLPAFDMMAPDNEQIAALKPDIVFVSGVTDVGGTDLYADLKEMDICVINIPSSSSIEGVREDILFIAACVDKVEEGNVIVEEMDAEIQKIADIGNTITDKKTVYFEIAAAPYAYSFGSQTFLNEMIELIGAENILATQEGWLSVDTESVIAANPDVIMTNVNYIENPVDEILTREGWSGVAAIQNRDVYYIDNQASSLPNENIVDALMEMAVSVYPEYYEK